MTKRIFNVNDSVWVKLTEEGLEVLKADHEWWRNKYPLTSMDHDWEPPRLNNGWAKFQMWELMQKFGHTIGMGRRTPFDLGIVIDDGSFIPPMDGEELPD